MNASEGSLALVATAVDAAGNSGPSAPRNVHVDSTPPLVLIEDPAEDPLITKEASIHVAGQVQASSPRTCHSPPRASMS